MSFKTLDSWLGFHCDSSHHLLVGPLQELQHSPGLLTATSLLLLHPASQVMPGTHLSASLLPSIQPPQLHTLDLFSTMGLGTSFSF